MNRRRKLKWKSIWKHVPIYSRFCNTFVSITMISSVMQIIIVDVFLLIMYYFIKPIIPTECSNIKEIDAVLFCSGVAIILGLPATGYKRVQLYRREHDGKEISQVKRTLFLTLCEFIVILQIPYLFWMLVIYFYRLVNAESVFHCMDQFDTTMKVVLILDRFVAFYAYLLCWYQIIIFNRIRDHALLQRGIYTACKIFLKPKPDRAITTMGQKIADIKQRLYQAASRNQIEIVQKCIQEAILVGGIHFPSTWYTCKVRFFKMFTWSARNPLHVACAKGNLDVVKLLLDNGWDVNMMDKVLWTSMGFSDLYNQMFSLLSFLRNLHFSYRNSATSSKLGNSDWCVCTLLAPLHIASSIGNVDLVQLLVQNGAHVNLPAISNVRKEATPPLFWARCPDCVTVLIKAHANHLYIPGRGFYLTPLQVSVLDGHFDVANRIQSMGGDLALTPLHRACSNGNIKKAHSLLRQGTDPDVLGEHSDGIYLRTPLHWAAMCGQLEAVKLLDEYGAQIDARDATGRTPLSWACYHNHTDVVQYLLSVGADADSKDNQNRSIAMLTACIDGIHPSIFRELTLAGLNINEAKCNGDTALHIAIKNGHRSTAISLLRAGADMMLINAEGLRAIDCTSASDLQYALKKEAGNRDVMISYSHSRTEFANRIRSSIEQNNITTWFDHINPSGIGGGAEWREEIARGISNCSVMLCILSEEYSLSQWCMKELALAKQYGKPVVAIACEDCELTDELQVYLMSRQIIDFKIAIIGKKQITARMVEFQYDHDIYDSQLRLLLDGLRDEIEMRRVTSSRRERIENNTTMLSYYSDLGSLDTTTGSSSDTFLFISHGDCHLKFSHELKTSFKLHGISSYLDTSTGYATPEERMRAAKDAILHCSAFVVILSGTSSSTSILSDQLAFAEDRGKPIVPILFSNPALSLGKQYTLSVNRVFHFARNIGYDDSFNDLFEEVSHLTMKESTPVVSPAHHQWKSELL